MLRAIRLASIPMVLFLLACEEDSSLTEPDLLSITMEQPAALVVGAPVTFGATASGPGPFQFTSAGEPIPQGLTLDGATGEITGTPTPAALLHGSTPGEWGGIVIRVSNGSASAETDPFPVMITGAAVPTPYAYMSFDSNLDDAFGLAGTPEGSVTAGQTGSVGNAVRVGGTESRIHYSTSLSKQLNGKSGFTYAASIQTASSASMFFSLSDQYSAWSRAYAELSGGRVSFGGRSRNAGAESYQWVVGDSRVDDGSFHSVVGVLDLPDGRIDLYVDGLLDNSDAPGFAQSTFEDFEPADQNVIGHISNVADTQQAPEVTHDEVALWAVALDEYQAVTVAWLARTGVSLEEWGVGL